MAERSERATGTPNTSYDLASVLYHALQAGASYDQYIRDAEEAGDRELIEFSVCCGTRTAGAPITPRS
jgi:hypothetical protein